MKTLDIQLTPLKILAIFIIPLAIVIALVPSSALHKDEVVTPDALLQSFNDGTHYVNPDVIADALIQKNPNYQLIDVRSADDYNLYHLPSAINIPLHNILDEQWNDYLNQDIRTNIFYANGTVEANQAWMLCKLRGFSNNYVLQGGLNFWTQTIVNPKIPPQTAPSDEKALYDFRKAAGVALGGAAEPAPLAAPETELPVKTPITKKKQRTSGGCS